MTTYASAKAALQAWMYTGGKGRITPESEAAVIVGITDALQAQIDTLSASVGGQVTLKGDWDASAGTFPGAGAAMKGWFYRVSVAGTVNGIAFTVGDGIYAQVDSASTTTYASNWQKAEGIITSAEVIAALGYSPTAETTTTVGALISGATAKTTPVDADAIGLIDSAASNILKKLTWANVKATLKTYFDTLYDASGAASSAQSAAIAACPAETTTTIGSLIHGATAKTTPVDADELGLIDSAASNALKRLTWANLKATLKTYFDTLYAPVGGGSGALTLLAVLTASNNATIDDTTHITSTYDDYLIVIENMVPTSNGVAFLMQVTTNAGSSWIATGYNDGINTTGFGFIDPLATAIAVPDTANAGFCAQFTIFNVNSTTNMRHASGLAVMIGTYTMGGRLSTTGAAINGLRFKFAAGNISTGKIKIYGIQKV